MSRPEVLADVADADLAERTVLVTGSSRGIGRGTALALGRLGADVVVHGRDRDAGQDVQDALDDLGVESTVVTADFADFDAVRDLASETARFAGDDLAALVNNAGGYFPGARRTDAGGEYTFAVNHLAPFCLTAELWPALAAGDGGRVVTVSSEAHRSAGLGDLARHQMTTLRDYSGWRAYCRSKLANVQFTRELARRTPAGDAVTANCCHPGVVPGSGFMRNLPGPLGALGGALEALPFSPVEAPAEAAATSVYLAVSPAVADVSGGYFDDCRERRPSAAARDDAAARRLWATSHDLVDVPAVGPYAER